MANGCIGLFLFEASAGTQPDQAQPQTDECGGTQ